MTKNEAIDVLHVQMGVHDELGNKGEVEALDMAINALTAQPETHEERTETRACDCIERQVAENAICNACGKIDCDQMDTCEMLKLPSAQPEEIDSESCNELKKKCEELKAHIEYLRRQNDSMKGEIKALIFAVRCCGVSGNEVQYESN